MSHDQRPGKLRVVRDATPTSGKRAGDPSAMSSASGAVSRGGVAADNALPGSGGTDAAVHGAAAANGKALPMLQAGIFLLACVLGGVAFVIARSF